MCNSTNSTFLFSPRIQGGANSVKLDSVAPLKYKEKAFPGKEIVAANWLLSLLASGGPKRFVFIIMMMMAAEQSRTSK